MSWYGPGNSAYIEGLWNRQYTVDSLQERCASNWRLKLILPMIPAPRFFHNEFACTSSWLGFPVWDGVFITTLRGKFLSWGHPSAATPYEWTGFSYVLDESGRGRTIGDTLFVYNLRMTNPADSAFANRFAAACSQMRLNGDHQRYVMLYLRATYPLRTVFIIDDPAQMDQFYLFFYSVADLCDDVLCNDEWVQLLEPGVRKGDILARLPVVGTSKRPEYPLPTVWLEHNDGSWFREWNRSEKEDPNCMTITAFVLDEFVAAQIKFRFGLNGLPEDIRLLRILDFSRYFNRYFVPARNK